ncbi:hypothetical protein AYO47_03510 [Planctomyces sp. SCGC AG-212-M04]|nr:hypothetical protein AYO47_03510 [Planctomyces sp. SCGC AG-212-M04]
MILRRLLCAVCGLALISGCSSGPERPPTYPVSGTVTLKGKPLEGARVVFVSSAQSGMPASGVTDADGVYHLTTFDSGDGALAGTYGVKVAKYDNWDPDEPAGEAKEISYEEEQKLVFADDEKPHPVAKSILPKKYDNEGTSGLTHTVTEAPTTFDIKLE